MRFASLAGQLPPPTGLKRKWLDAITVDISWEKPHGLPEEDSVYTFEIKNLKVRLGMRLMGNLV